MKTNKYNWKSLLIDLAKVLIGFFAGNQIPF